MRAGGQGDQARGIRQHRGALPAVQAICSVSSAILVDELVEKAGKYKDRILVTHPFNPPHLVPMFELSGGTYTSPEVKQYVKEFLESMGRVVVMVKKPAPGFIATRLQEALWRECLYIVENGIADPEDVDKAAKFSFMPRYTSIGMFEHFDCGGMKLSSSVNNYLFPYLSDAKKNPKIMDDMIVRGELGQIVGKGFYDWTNVDMDKYRARVSAPFWRFFDWDLPKE
jgi:3-hydroxybutyryl-CoA dehydrogenase